ncbi:MAG: hypothetical protein JWO46_2422, partial [Nocardioidaceae bacterium]|nr:hypothetical protein [Nocardioidaceae bacterium]
MTGLADRLLGLAPADLRAFFADTPAVEITGLIRDTTDAELRRLVADDGVRAEAVRAILDRFVEFADAERLATITGVVCFDLARERGPHERHTVRIGDGAVDLVDPSTRPDVTVGAPILDFVRLVTGQSNAALLYLSGRLGIDGHAMLALAVGSVFIVPGSDQAA